MRDPGLTGGRRRCGRRIVGRRTTRLAALALAAAFALPAAATAQDREAWEPGPVQGDTRSTLELTASAGVILPMSMLGSQGDTLQAELSTKQTFGATLEVWFGGGFGLGVSGGYGSPDLTLTRADIQTGMQDVEELGSVDYLHGEALLLWRPELHGSAEVMLPYFGAGAGVRRLDFEDGSGFEDTSDLTLVLNAGAQVRVSDAVHLRLDVRDLISSFEGGPFENSDLQHDLYAQVGLGIGL